MSAEYRAILLRTTDARPALESIAHVRSLRELQTSSAIDRFYQKVAVTLSLGSRALAAYTCMRASWCLE